MPANPVSRDLVRAHMTPGVFYTVAEIATAAASAIPPEVAARRAPTTTRGRVLTIEERIDWGRRALVGRVAVEMCRDGLLDRQGGRHGGVRYALPKESPRLRRAAAAPPPDLLAGPSPNTESGVTAQMVYHAVRANPDATLDRLVAILAPCFNDAGVLRKYHTEIARLRRRHGRPDDDRPLPADPATLDRARRRAVHNVLLHLMKTSPLSGRQETVYNVPPDHPGEPR